MICQRCGNTLAPGAQFCNQCGTPVPASAGTPIAAAPKSGCGKGAVIAIVALVVVFIVIPVIGIIAAIAIPNFLTAKQRAMQKRTIAEMRGAAQAVDLQRQSHNNALPESIPAQKDGWGNNLRYTTDGTNYWIVSAGKDGRFEEDDPSHYTPGATTNFDADLVLENGEMRRWPEGVGGR